VIEESPSSAVWMNSPFYNNKTDPLSRRRKGKDTVQEKTSADRVRSPALTSGALFLGVGICNSLGPGYSERRW
jgi:hypothetical protein